MKQLKWILPLVVVAALAASYWMQKQAIPMATGGKAVIYQCSMHPQVVQAGPGSCPICHMDLDRKELDADDPIVRRLGLKAGAGTAQPAAKPAVSGKAGFTLDEHRQQLIGVASEEAKLAPLTRTLRLPGRSAGGREVQAQLLELDAGRLKAGQKAVLIGPDRQELAAVVASVEGGLDSLTRSFGVSLRAKEGAPWLRPGVYVEVRVALAQGERLSVPADAILDTGLRQVIFVEKEGGKFEPREVKTGERGDERTEVVEGLKAGERVVTKANFLIDSESRFKAALEQF